MAAVADLPEATPTKVMFGTTAVMVVRRGDVVHALKETCAHAGGPLSEGELKDDTITCPWHSSVFRTADGSVGRCLLPVADCLPQGFELFRSRA